MSKAFRHTTRQIRWAVVAMCLMQITLAQAWVLTINAGSRRLFLQVGNGTLDTAVATVNQVSVTVPAAQLGNSTAQAMTSSSTQANSPWDGFTVCDPSSGQVYVGGYYRRSSAAESASATLQVASPANLTNATGDVIPFSAISWTSTALGNATADIPAGTFNGGTQFLRTIAANTYVENVLVNKSLTLKGANAGACAANGGVRAAESVIDGNFTGASVTLAMHFAGQPGPTYERGFGP